MPRIAFRNFTGGEVTPTLCARYDLQKFGTFLNVCQNFIPNLHGDIERRPGTHYLATLSSKSVLVPFSFNTEPSNNFALAFGADGTARVFNEDGTQIGSFAHPYSLSACYQLSFSQVGDVVYFAHRDYPLRKLVRSGTAPSYTWTFSVVQFNNTLSAPSAPTVTWHRGPKNDDSEEEYTKNETSTLRYVVTALDSDGTESIASGFGSCTARYPSDWVNGDYVDITWTPVSGATEYNIYRESAGYYGFIGTSSSSSFRDENFEPDTATTPQKEWNPFASDNPSCVCFHQQRMVLAGMKKSPATFYMSRTGDYENFRKSLPVKDDDPIEFMIASGSIDEIRWVCSFDNLLLGTSGAEYKVSGGSSSITPKDVSISTQSYWGSSNLQPLIIGQSIMHSQRNGSHVRDLYYSWESDGYSGNDLSLLAPQLVETHQLKQWCFQQAPGSNIWAVREDGALLCLTYMKEQNVFGWSRHITNGKVISVCSLSGDSEDVVLFLVERVINGSTKYFLEKLSTRFKDTTAIEDAFYVDAGKTVTASTATNTHSGFSHLNGCTVSVLADGSPETHIVTNGTITLDYPAKKVTAGLGYTSVLAPMPIETDAGGGTTMGKRRAYGKCILRFYRSVGGHYAASRLGDIYDGDAWKNRDWFDLPYLPDVYGDPCQPFSGDIELSLPSGQDADSTILIRQDRPMPFRVISIICDVDFGEQ